MNANAKHSPTLRGVMIDVEPLVARLPEALGSLAGLRQ
jgi:hypothetical protein